MWFLVPLILFDCVLEVLLWAARRDPPQEKRKNPLECVCGYSLRGLTGREECPECRRPFNPHMRAIEEAKLNARESKSVANSGESKSDISCA